MIHNVQLVATELFHKPEKKGMAGCRLMDLDTKSLVAS